MTLRWLPAVPLLLCLVPSVSGHSWSNKVLDDLEELFSHDHSSSLRQAVRHDFTMDQALLRASRSYERSSDGSHVLEHMSGMDMKLTPSQYRRLHGGQKSRTSGSILAIPWTHGIIPYEIQTQDFNQDQLTWIHKAMNDWGTLTCVRFRPATPSDTQHKIFIRKGSGCWAHLGMIRQNPQIVNLEAGGVGCFWKGLIHHELGHTIGLIHEHQRQQRDAYIRVNYYMVMSNMIDAVEKYAVGVDTKLGLPYDYGSVMHYGKTAFSSGFYRQTIHTRDPTKEDVIGMTLGPSFYDAKLVNLMYKCAERCHSPPSCAAECFVNEHCRCVCKEDMPKEVCRDLISDCAERARRGDCINHYGMMHHSCRKTCGICNNNGSIPHLVCVNGYSDCAERAARGECQTDFNNMQYNCRLACGLCKTPDMLPSPGPCVDKISTCQAMATQGACYRNMSSMLRDCTKSCEFCPENLGKDPADKPGCVDYDAGACYYRADSNLCSKYYTLMATKCAVACGRCTNFTMPAGCVDSNTECPGWAMRDECSNNPGYMLKGCKLSCDTCEGLNKPEAQCEDYSLNCQDYVDRKECFANPSWMFKNCKKSCKHCPGDPPFGIPCDNFNPNCQMWASTGECQSNKGWMFPHCNLACGQCKAGTVDYNNGTCRDDHLECYYWSVNGECERNPTNMHRICPKSCHICIDDGGSGSTDTPTRPTRPTSSTDTPTGPCHDNHQTCPEWARGGQCNENPGYMLINCKHSCKVCDGPCADDNQYCPDWAEHGECQRNPGYMLRHCRISCKMC